MQKWVDADVDRDDLGITHQFSQVLNVDKVVRFDLKC